MITVSLATIPSRIEFIEPVIKSLIDQTTPPGEIQIQIPRICKKEQRNYEIPDFIKNYSKVEIIVHEEDLGAANKWYYPIVDLKDNPDSVLIVIDDDCSYEPESLELLVGKISQNPDVAFCHTGGILPRMPQRLKYFGVSRHPLPETLTIIEKNIADLAVDTMQGFSMFVLRPYWFRNFDFSVLGMDMLHTFNDDMLIAGLLEFLNIPRIQLAPYKIPSILHQSEINPIHGEGRLLKMSMDGIIFLQSTLGIWKDVTCIYPGKKTIVARLLDKIRRIVSR